MLVKLIAVSSYVARNCKCDTYNEALVPLLLPVAVMGAESAPRQSITRESSKLALSSGSVKKPQRSTEGSSRRNCYMVYQRPRLREMEREWLAPVDPWETYATLWLFSFAPIDGRFVAGSGKSVLW